MLLSLPRVCQFCPFICRTSRSTFKIFGLKPIQFTNMSSVSSDLIPLGSDMSIDISLVHAFRTPEFIFVNKLFLKYGYDIRIAGGAVRDILMRKEPKDVDMATTATPAEMIKMFTLEGIRMLNRNGEAHGTVTIRVNDSVNYEITTLRIDTKTDGRHAEVIFTTDWQLDSSRRDLTVNSMFICVSFEDGTSEDPSKVIVKGKLYDYFNGYDDLAHRRIHFVGEPSARIKEDYLRILRYFRFHGRLANDPDDHDEIILKSIKDNAMNLEKIAGERIWTELKMIFLYPSAPSLLQYMTETGVTSACGLPAQPNFAEMNKVYQNGLLNRGPNSATCVASVFNSIEEFEAFNQHVKLSTLEESIIIFLVKWRDVLRKHDVVESLRREYLLSTNHSMLKPVFTEGIRYLCSAAELDSWISWEAPRFPVTGTLVSAKLGVKGRELGSIMQALRKIWVHSSCTLKADELLAENTLEKVSKRLLEEAEMEPMIPIKKKK